MIIGNFELNFDNGEIRYKTSTTGKNHSLDADIIKSLVYTNVKMIDKYLPGIIAVAKSGMSPADAIAQTETPTTGEQDAPTTHNWDTAHPN
ncbi:hypothetical protein [Coleofasciculus sp.]|uniref:hypothetical protein n=1 Tax=Coleofasciculus sp. TaxID=3100458 RepID=UPI003A3B7967